MTLAGDIARFCRLTWDRGLVSAAGGTFSARIGDTDTFLITPSGVALRDTEPDDPGADRPRRAEAGGPRARAVEGRAKEAPLVAPASGRQTRPPLRPPCSVA